MAVLEVLAEVIGAEELLGLVAFAKFVNMVEMLGACFPARRVGELFTTVPTDVRTVASHGGVEGGFRPGERGAGPGMTTQVKGILVAFGFVLVFEAVRTVSAAILFLGFVQPMVG